MPKGYERRKRSASSITAPASRSVTMPDNFSETVKTIKSTTTGRERGQAIAAAAKAKAKPKKAKMTDAERKKRVAAMAKKAAPAMRKVARARKAKKG
jgi:hypothetical protein